MQLNASTRELLGKRTRRLHRQGKLAAVVYGHNTKPTALVLDRLEFQKVFLKSGRTHLVDLLVDSGRTEKVLVREIQTHPRRLGPIHVDFYAVSLEEKITVEVPIHLTGESAAVKRGDADILQPIHALRVECLPTDIPEAFEVDLTPLEEIDSEVRVSDISVPKGVTVLIDADELVVKIVHKRELKVEEEIPAAEAVVPAEGEAGAEGEAAAEGETPAAEDAISFAVQSANVALFGIVLATFIASFGVQDVLKDYVSGYYILLERHIRVGDRITLEGVGAGTVTEVKLRVTLMKTDAGDLLVVPNSELFNKAVTVHVPAVERAAETKPTPPG